MQISFSVITKLITTLVFTTQIVQCLFFLNSNFQASSYLLWLYKPISVRPGRKPQRPVYSCHGSNYFTLFPRLLKVDNNKQEQVAESTKLVNEGYRVDLSSTHYSKANSYTTTNGHQVFRVIGRIYLFFFGKPGSLVLEIFCIISLTTQPCKCHFPLRT